MVNMPYFQRTYASLKWDFYIIGVIAHPDHTFVDGECTICGACEHAEWNDATCEDPRTCAKCGKTEGEALGHTEVTDEAVVPTCTATGLTEGKHCSVCKEVLVEQKEVAKLEHSFGEWKVVKEATYTEKGLKERVCSCGEKETEEIPMLEKPAVKPIPDAAVIIDINGRTEGETNPNTGAPVFDMTFAGIAVLAAAAMVIGKKNK